MHPERPLSPDGGAGAALLSPSGRKRLFFGILFAGALLRIFYLFEYATYDNFDLAIGADIGEYASRAKEIMAGRFFPAEPEIHAPFYSFFLAFLQTCGAGVPAIRIIQTLLNFGACVWLFFIMGSAGVSDKVRFCFLAGILVLAPFIFHPAELISESLLLPLFAAVFHFLTAGEKREDYASWPWLLGAGIFSGLAFLTHGLAGAFLPVMLLFFAVRREGVRCTAFAAGAILVILPFCIAKSVHYGKPVGIQGNTGFNIYLGNNPKATGGCFMRPGNLWRKSHIQARDEAVRRGITTDRLWLERAADFWCKTPGKAALLWAKKIPMIFSGNDLIAGADGGFLFCRSETVNLTRFLTLPIICLALPGIWFVCRNRKKEPLWWPPLLLALALFAAQVMTVTSGRYRLMMFPGILYLAAAGCAGIDWKKCFLPFLLLFLFCLWCTYGFVIRDRREGCALLGEAAFRKGDFSHARDLLLFARRGGMKDSSRIENILGNIAEKEGDFVQARKWYAGVVKAEPYMPEGWMNLANLTPDPRLAETYFRKALEASGSSPAPDLLFNYARLLYGTKRKNEAKELIEQALHTSPEMPQACNLSGIIAMEEKRFRDAEQLFYRAARLAGNEPGFWRNTAVAARLSGNRKLQISAEKRFFELQQKRKP
ncbi:MAG: tetratricopeptide repeat protein [Lentisphaeria bacterium]|nr:tetratricopeptide repeat protein [Lentisphaeria bacterium]